MTDALHRIQDLLGQLQEARRASPTQLVTEVVRDGLKTTVDVTYAARPSLAEDDLRRIEEDLGVTLPAEYRAFAREIGDGLEVVLPPLATIIARTSVETDGQVAADYVPEADPIDGVLLLENVWDSGCDHCTWLVVSGPQRGAVFHTTDEGGADLVDPSFLAWLAERLQLTLAQEQTMHRVATAEKRPAATDAERLKERITQGRGTSLDELRALLLATPLPGHEYVFLARDAFLYPRVQILIAEAALELERAGRVKLERFQKRDLVEHAGRGAVTLADPRAIDLLTLALELGGDTDAHVALAEAYLVLGRLPEALATIDAVPPPGTAYVRARILRALGRREEARSAFIDAVEQAHGLDTRPANELIDVHIEDGDLARAEELCVRTINAGHCSHHTYHRLIVVRVLRGDIAGALTAIPHLSNTGFDLAALERDPRLAPLLADPRYATVTRGC
jgi:hypothetical protein